MVNLQKSRIMKYVNVRTNTSLRITKNRANYSVQLVCVYIMEIKQYDISMHTTKLLHLNEKSIANVCIAVSHVDLQHWLELNCIYNCQLAFVYSGVDMYYELKYV